MPPPPRDRRFDEERVIPTPNSISTPSAMPAVRTAPHADLAAGPWDRVFALLNAHIQDESGLLEQVQRAVDESASAARRAARVERMLSERLPRPESADSVAPMPMRPRFPTHGDDWAERSQQIEMPDPKAAAKAVLDERELAAVRKSRETRMLIIATAVGGAGSVVIENLFKFFAHGLGAH